METESTSDITDVARDLIRQGMNHALDCLTDAQQLVPFLMTLDKNGNRQLARFLSGDMPTDIAAARAEADRMANDVRAWVVVYDNFVRTPEGRFDAVSAEAGENGRWIAHRWSHCYSPMTDTQPLELIGTLLCTSWDRSKS